MDFILGSWCGPRSPDFFAQILRRYMEHSRRNDAFA